MMLRQSAGARRSRQRAAHMARRTVGAVLLVLLAACLPACGIKGPLRPPPKSAPAATPPSSDNPATPPPSTSPALPPPSSPPGNP